MYKRQKWKRKKLPGDRLLKYGKYLILLVFVLLLPLYAVDFLGQGQPWFCKLICPAGTLEAGIPLVLANDGLREAAGFLFAWKNVILAAVILAAIFVYRPSCHYLCPLGAIRCV